MRPVCILECLHNEGVPISPIKTIPTTRRRMANAIRKALSTSVWQPLRLRISCPFYMRALLATKSLDIPPIALTLFVNRE